jgi:hypothetical protein
MNEVLDRDPGLETDKPPYLFFAFSDLLLGEEEGIKENIQKYIQSATTEEEYKEFLEFCEEYAELMSPDLITALNEMKEEFLQKITREKAGAAAATKVE